MQRVLQLLLGFLGQGSLEDGAAVLGQRVHGLVRGICSTTMNSSDMPGFSIPRTWFWKASSTPALLTLPRSAPMPAPMAMSKNGMKKRSPKRNPQNNPQVAPFADRVMVRDGRDVAFLVSRCG